ncbi:hypothetical protein ACQBAR_06660 [Propionibacteriaceae bacterium Y1685]|uniref:hypothetical protein n=1 Tax=Microlunatus sp. Y1700 TaxID=3418487 RepID=UPI003B7EEC54
MNPSWRALPTKLNDAMAAVCAIPETCRKVETERDRAGGASVDKSVVNQAWHDLNEGAALLTRTYQERFQPYLEHDMAWIEAQRDLRGMLPGVDEIAERIEKSATATSWKGQDADLYRHRMKGQLTAIKEFGAVRKRLIADLEDAIVTQRALNLALFNNLTHAHRQCEAAIAGETECGRSLVRCAAIMTPLASNLHTMTSPENPLCADMINKLMEKQKEIDRIGLIQNQTWPGAPGPRRMTGRGQVPVA